MRGAILTFLLANSVGGDYGHEREFYNGINVLNRSEATHGRPDIRWASTAVSSGIPARSQAKARKHWRRNPSARPR